MIPPPLFECGDDIVRKVLLSGGSARSANWKRPSRPPSGAGPWGERPSNQWQKHTERAYLSLETIQDDKFTRLLLDFRLPSFFW